MPVRTAEHTLARIQVYSDGLAVLDGEKGVLTNAQLNTLIRQEGERPTSDDISYLEVWLGELPPQVKPTAEMPAQVSAPPPAAPVRPGVAAQPARPRPAASAPTPVPPASVPPAEKGKGALLLLSSLVFLFLLGCAATLLLLARRDEKAGPTLEHAPTSMPPTSIPAPQGQGTASASSPTVTPEMNAGEPSVDSSDDTLWLAYVSGSPGRANLYVVPVDLSAGYPVAEMERRVALATRPRFDEAEPSWSPDGRYLVFQADYDGNYDLWIVRRDGGEPINLTRTPARGEFEPAWWQGDKIYYRQGSPDGRIEEGTIYLLEGVIPQGGYEDQLPTPMRGHAPEVSAEGDVVYMATVGRVWQVFLYDSRFGTTSQLTTWPGGSCRWPMWSPRGDAIVYNLANSNLAPIGIARMTIEGSRDPEVLLYGESAGRPSWSSSGWIAFNSDKGIEVMDENGQRRHLLIPGDAWAPVWSH